MRGARALAALAALALSPAAFADREHADLTPAMKERLAAVAETAELIDAELADRRARLEARLRAYYKLSRAARDQLSLDRDARAAALRVRGAARRILRRELRELALVEAEREAAAAARARLRAAPLSAAVPARGSLARPVAGAAIAAPFGTHRDRLSRAHLVRRGVELASDVGADVVAPAAGEVVYAGALRGLGQAIVIDHGDFHTVLGRLRELGVGPGARVERGQPLAQAASTRVHLQVRTPAQAIDPAPLLAR